jgi:hypothetical protein
MPVVWCALTHSSLPQPPSPRALSKEDLGGLKHALHIRRLVFAGELLFEQQGLALVAFGATLLLMARDDSRSTCGEYARLRRSLRRLLPHSLPCSIITVRLLHRSQRSLFGLGFSSHWFSLCRSSGLQRSARTPTTLLSLFGPGLSATTILLRAFLCSAFLSVLFCVSAVNARVLSMFRVCTMSRSKAEPSMFLL